LNRALRAAEYIVRLEAPRLAGVGDPGPAPERFLARERVEWDVTRKRRPKRVDLRPSVDHVAWMEEHELPAELAGFRRNGARYLLVRTLLHDAGHARPEEVASAMLDRELQLEPVDLVRVRLLGKDEGGWMPLIPSPASAS
jgi:hypothetical protein